MTKDEILSDVQSIGVASIYREPFFGHILSGINKHIDLEGKQNTVTKITALGVTRIAFSVSAKMWIKLNKEQKIARFKKEIMHYILMHPWADKLNNQGLFYTSCDLSANKYAQDKLSLNLVNFRDMSTAHLGRKLKDEGYTDIFFDIRDMIKIINGKLSEKEKIELSMKALMGDFWKGDQLTEAIFFLPKTKGGDMNMSMVSQMVNDMQSEGASKADISEAIKELASSGDDPWADVGKGTSDLGAKELIKQAFKDAKMRGDVPGNLASYVDFILSPPRIDWRSEVRDFTATAGSVSAKTTMTRKSKRSGTYPSIKIRSTQKLAIIADTSGSVSDEEFQSFFEEMNGILAENAEIIFIQADAGVDSVDLYKGRLPENLSIMRVGNGGTAFGPALYYVKTRGSEQDEFDMIDRVDGVIYMTDGHAPAPEHEDYPLCKVMWLTTQRSVEDMEAEGFEGRIVYLDLED
jgi:predicted metal-dependent peptidase